jgi:hypothetical protein
MGNREYGDKMRWVKWQDSDILRCEKTDHHFAWVKYYPDLGYKVQLWDDNIHPRGWVDIAIVPDLDTAKMIAKLNVHGELVHD